MNLKSYAVLLSLLVCLNSQAQKYDYLWLLGYNNSNGDTTDPHFSTFQMDFNSTPVGVHRRYRPYEMSCSSACISTSSGQFAVATDGYFIYNSLNEIMENGTGLNPGKVGDDFYSRFQATYPMHHGSMFLPAPDNDSLFYMFHTAYRYDSLGNFGGVFCDKLYYSVIDLRLMDGLGKVIEKNHLLLEDTLMSGDGFSACKHANGRDWWLIMQEMRTNCFYTFLLTPTGVEYHGKQCIGDTVHFGYDWGSSAFSPDGNKYIWSNHFENLNILDFDRCSGTFSNYVRVIVSDAFIAPSFPLIDGVAVSASSRYLYLATGTQIRQFDLSAGSNIASTEVFIEYNTLQGTPQSSTFFCQLAPDGKIYIGINGTDTLLHVINYPDLEAGHCGYVRCGIRLPTYNSLYLPYYPNYRLGPLPGSSCDTLGLGLSQPLAKPSPIEVYPNPATNYVLIDYGNIPWGTETLWLEMHDLSGRLVLKQQLPPYSALQKLDISQFPDGSYNLSINSESLLLANGQLIKIKGK